MVSKLVHPVLFSQEFGVAPTLLDTHNLLDPILNCDTKLFIDPLLLSTSNNALVQKNGYKLLKDRFSKIIQLIDASKTIDDKAWRTAAGLLDLDERPETGLGYGGSGTSGSSRPETIKQQVLKTAKEIIELGEDNPEIISLMGLFEEGVGPDTISDLTSNILLPVLCKVTEDFCDDAKIPTRQFGAPYHAKLPENPLKVGKPIIFVPKDIIRHLPLAVDWSDVSRVINEIDEIRKAFNNIIGPIAQATVTEKKAALKAASLQSLEAFQQLFQTLLSSSTHYDPNQDILNFYAFRSLMSGNLAAFKTAFAPAKKHDAAELRRIVDEVIKHFRQMVENNNLWELLWDGRRPKRERASQLLFFTVAELFCKANNIEVSPEVNMGGGPVDFKFSSGHGNRLLVEIKLSKGQVEHGYKKQLEKYKMAAQTEAAIFLVINVGGMGFKLRKIQEARAQKIKNGETASDIVVVDGRRQTPPSQTTAGKRARVRARKRTRARRRSSRIN